MGLCCCCRWFLFPTKILHVYFITLFTALNEYTLLMLCFAIMHTGPKWLAITGFVTVALFVFVRLWPCLLLACRAARLFSLM